MKSNRTPALACIAILLAITPPSSIAKTYLAQADEQTARTPSDSVRYPSVPAWDALVPADKQLGPTAASGMALETVLRDIGRQCGLTFLPDSSVRGRLLDTDFQPMSARDRLRALAKLAHVKFEQAGDNTLFVTDGVLEEPERIKAQTIKPDAEAKPTPIEAATPEALDALIDATKPKLSAEGLQNAGTTADATNNGNAPGANGTASNSDANKVSVTAHAEPPQQKLSISNEPSIPAAPTSSGKSKVMLYSGLEHFERLPPVTKKLATGAKVSISQLKALTPDNLWARLPEFAAGSWQLSSMTAYYRYNFVHGVRDTEVDTFMDKGAETMGWERDKNNNLWQPLDREFYTISEGEDSYAIDLHHSYDVIEQTDKHFTVHFISVRAVVPKATLKVKRVFQLEAIQTYTPAGDGIMRCNSSLKTFDEQGLPLLLQKGICYERKIRPYHQAHMVDGRDMPRLFAEYLVTHGLGALVPDRQVSHRN